MWFERLLSLGLVLVGFGSQRAAGISNFCLQDPFFKGECDKNQLRWSFNQQWETCTPFIFGGCGGNENNFGSKEDCVAACIENAGAPSGSGRSVAFELEPQSHLINETQGHDSDQNTMINLPKRCLDEMVHHAPIRKTKKCKVEFVDEVSQSSKSKRGWTFDAQRNRCRRRPYLEAACADTKNKFITSSECKRVCESKGKQDIESEPESKFWKSFKKQSYKNNFKLRKEMTDWIASCSDHPVWVVNKLRKNWMETLSQYDSTQAGYSYNQLTKKCMKVKDIVKSPTLNKFFTKSECARCQVLREEIKPTCLRQPQIAPVGFCTSKESVIQSVEDTGDHFIDNYDEDQSLLRRRRRRRRNQLLRSKFDRNPAAKKVWSYFDGSCMAYTADSCINTKNSFRSRAECKHKCPTFTGMKSTDLTRSPSHDRLFKNLYFYHPDQPNMKGVFFFYLPMHYKVFGQIDVNRLLKASKRRSSAKGRSEVSDDEGDKKDKLITGSGEGRVSWSMYDLRDREVVNKEKADLKAKLKAEAEAKAKKKVVVETTTNQPTNDEDSPVSEDTTLPPKPKTTTRKFMVLTLKVKRFTPTTLAFKFDTTTERTYEKSSHQPHPRCSDPPPAFGRCKRALTTVWSFLDSECEELRHNLCSVKIESSNIFMSKAECLSVCKNMETGVVTGQAKPNSPAIAKVSTLEQEKQKCRAPPTSIARCKPPTLQTKPAFPVDAQKGRLSLVTNDLYTNIEADQNQQGRQAEDGEVDYSVAGGETMARKAEDDFEGVAESQEHSRQQRRRHDASHESVEGRLGVSSEDFGQPRSSDDDGDIGLGRSADDVDDEEGAAGRSDVFGESEIIGQSWIVDRFSSDEFPEKRAAADEDEDETHVLVKRKVNKSGEDEVTSDGSAEQAGESKAKGRTSSDKEGSDYTDNQPEQRRADEESEDENDEETRLGRSDDSKESTQRQKRNTVVHHSGYVFIDGFCIKVSLKPGECLKMTDNFFTHLNDCTKACTRPDRIRKPASEVM